MDDPGSKPLRKIVFSFSDVFSRELMSCALREGGRGGREGARQREREKAFLSFFVFRVTLGKVCCTKPKKQTY
jgi:hypothetical protein